jgi:microcystin-dependent protein
MSEPFISEIRMFGGNFAPIGWALCNGQVMPISQNTALFSLLGTTYGGDGRSTFALPNLQGAAPLQAGQGPGLSPRTLGEIGGEQVVPLTVAELPAHTHSLQASSSVGSQITPTGNSLAQAGALRGEKVYGTASNGQLSPHALSATGQGLPHNNMPPYLGVTFIIALQGIFPARS